jgi:hypothetical protein
MLLRDWLKSIGKFRSETKNYYLDSFLLIQVINYLVGAKYVFNLKKSFRDVSKTTLSHKGQDIDLPYVTQLTHSPFVRDISTFSPNHYVYSICLGLN